MGSDDHLDLTSNGITKVMAMNVTGHAMLFNGLLDAKKLAANAKVVYTTTEIARGMVTMAVKPAFASIDAACITSHIVGKPACGYVAGFPYTSVLSSYSYAKAIGSLYFQHAAKENPAMTVYAISPGMCYGTDAPVAGMPWGMKAAMGGMPWLINLQIRAGGLVGMVHSPAVGTKRTMDALFGRGAVYPSGTFIGAVRWATGPTCDQAISHPDLYSNPALQQAVASAVRKAIVT